MSGVSGVSGDCPCPIEIRQCGARAPARVLCGCGSCPPPDLSPEQMAHREEDEWLAAQRNLAAEGKP